MSKRHRCCCDPCYDPCCDPCYIPCYKPVGNYGYGGGSFCWIIILIIIFCVLCRKDKDHGCF